MLKSTLNSIMQDLQRISKVNKEELITQRVQRVIDASVESYKHKLDVNYDYLLYRDTIKVYRNIIRERMRKNKKETKRWSII